MRIFNIFDDDFSLEDSIKDLRTKFSEMFQPIDEKSPPKQPYPAINMIIHNNENIQITIDVPGVEKGDLNVQIEGKVLTIAGKRELTIPQNDDQNTYKNYLNERLAGAFARQVDLPFMVDNEKVSASYKQGILSVELVKEQSDEKVYEVKVE
jgi:HSP20 family protein